MSKKTLIFGGILGLLFAWFIQATSPDFQKMRGKICGVKQVTLYAEGKPVQTWNTSGPVEKKNLFGSAYEFIDMNGERVTITGQFTVARKGE